MKFKRRSLGEGMRWLVLAALPSRVRARGDAVEWLLDDPVFAGRAGSESRPFAPRVRSTGAA